jgi:hypothetical protein
VEEGIMLPWRLFVRWWLVVARREFVRVEGGPRCIIRSEGAKKCAARKWMNHGQHPLLPPAGGWAISSSSRQRARSPSFEDDVDWEALEAEAETEAEAESAPTQRVLILEDFITDSD